MIAQEHEDPSTDAIFEELQTSLMESCVKLLQDKDNVIVYES